MTVVPGGRILRAERLRKREEIQAVRASGVRFSGVLVTVFLLPAPSYRFGVIAGRRVGIAVQRNRARRVIREALRLLRGGLRAESPTAILVAARPGAATARRQAVSAEIEALLRRQGLLD